MKNIKKSFFVFFIFITMFLLTLISDALSSYNKLEKSEEYYSLNNINNLISTKIPDVYIWRGDITTLKVDAIVNAANKTLLGGGGVDGAIHKAAGKQLLEECIKLNGCKTGEAKITLGYKLPCKYIIHTVGPIVNRTLTTKDCELLASCYNSCLKLAEENKLDSIAFCCIATGAYNFPNEEAAKIAIESIKNYKNMNKSKIKVIFNVFTKKDELIYKKFLTFE